MLEHMVVLSFLRNLYTVFWAFQMALVAKNLPANAGDVKRFEFNLCVRKIPWRRAWQPTPVFLPGEAHGQRSLVGHRVTESQT